MTNQWHWGIKPVSDDKNDFENIAYNKIMNGRLKGVEDGPETAAGLAKATLADALSKAKEKPEMRMAVRRVCRGTARGMADIAQDLAQTSGFLLKNLHSASAEFGIEPKDMLLWCFEGIADVTLLAGPGPRANILKVIDIEFPGAGADFTEVCRKAKLKQWWTK